MSDIAKHTLPDSIEANDVEASPFIVEGGQLLVPEAEAGRTSAEQVFGFLQRYEDRVDGLVTKVTEQATEVNELARAVETERRAALGARHRLQVTQLEAKQQIEEITHGAERAQIEAEYQVQLANKESIHRTEETVRTRAQLEEARITIGALRERLEMLEELRGTSWYQFGRRRQLTHALLSLPEKRRDA